MLSLRGLRKPPPALALFVGCFLLSAVPAAAQAIWWATLTPQAFGLNNSKLGCSNEDGGSDTENCQPTVLSKNSFWFEEKKYTIFALYLTGGTLSFQFQGATHINGSTLFVGSSSFRWADGTASGTDPRIVGWANSGLSWTANTPVLVSLEPPHTHGPPPGKPTLTLVTSGPNAQTATTLSFTIPCVTPGNAPVTDYVLFAEKMSDNSALSPQFFTVPWPCRTMTATLTGLTEATQYRVRAFARNLFARHSEWSDWAQGTTVAMLVGGSDGNSGQQPVLKPEEQVPPPAEGQQPENLGQPPNEDSQPQQGGAQPVDLGPPQQGGEPPAEQLGSDGDSGDSPPAEGPADEEQPQSEPPPAAVALDGIAASPDSVREDAAATTITLTVTLDKTKKLGSEPVVFTLVSPTQGKTAKRGEDFDATLTDTLTIAQGRLQGTAPLVLTPKDNTTADGDKAFAVQVTSSTGHRALIDIKIIDDEPAFAFAGPVAAQAYTAGTAITPLQLPAAVGGQGAVTYRVAGLPAGLSFAASTRTISGTPEAATEGAVEVSYTAQDSTGAIALTFTITVNPPLGFGDLFN